MGTRKGRPNKIPAAAKENIAAVFVRLGGTAEMAKWAKNNLTEFYKLYGRLIPVEQHVSGALGTYEAIPVETRDYVPSEALESTAGSTTDGDQATHH